MGECWVNQANAIELKNLSKRFGKVVANDKINLTVRYGEILAILGENGSGKTTLMNMISGIYYPDEGQIFVGGEEVEIRSPRDAFPLGIGMIHQHFKLVDVLTAAENIVLGLGGPTKLDIRQVATKINKLTDQYGFELDPFKKIYEMSVSEKQTVEIVKMLYRGANILILDEPTNGLDIPSKTILRSLLAAYADEKRTIVISTHQVREVENLIDKIVILDEQGLVLAATTEELSHRLTFGPLPADAKAIYSTPSFSGEEGIALNTTGRESRPDLELIFAATTHDRMTIPSILHTNPTNHE